jgi:hypothetical protein
LNTTLNIAKKTQAITSDLMESLIMVPKPSRRLKIPKSSTTNITGHMPTRNLPAVVKSSSIVSIIKPPQSPKRISFLVARIMPESVFHRRILAFPLLA